MIKKLRRHAGENQHPVNNCFDWIPVATDSLSFRDISHILWVAFAGMTE